MHSNTRKGLGSLFLPGLALLSVSGCLKDPVIDPTPPITSNTGIKISSVSSNPTGNTLCKDKSGILTVTGMQNFEWFTTGTPNSFYKKQLPCSAFQFRVERVEGLFSTSGIAVGSVNDQCQITLQDSVQASSGQNIKIFATPKSYPNEIASELIQCIEPTTGGGGTPTPTPANQNVSIAAVYAKTASAVEVCAGESVRLIIEGYINNQSYSTEFGSSRSWDCSDFDFTVEKINWAGATVLPTAGHVNFLCDLRLWSSHSDGTIRVEARYRNHPTAFGVAQWRCGP
jgi:hypothetical protein